jgi:hypothetical protein
VNDRQHPMPQDEYTDPRAQELAGHLSVLGDIDFWVTPDHVAKRFHELLDEIGNQDPSAARAEGLLGGRPAPPAGRPAAPRGKLRLGRTRVRWQDEATARRGPGAGKGAG